MTGCFPASSCPHDAMDLEKDLQLRRTLVMAQISLKEDWDLWIPLGFPLRASHWNVSIDFGVGVKDKIGGGRTERGEAMLGMHKHSINFQLCVFLKIATFAQYTFTTFFCLLTWTGIGLLPTAHLPNCNSLRVSMAVSGLGISIAVLLPTSPLDKLCAGLPGTVPTHLMPPGPLLRFRNCCAEFLKMESLKESIFSLFR